MATARRQVVSNDSAGASSLVINITSSLAHSVLWVWTASGSGTPTLNLPTDSATQTYSNLTPQVTNAGNLVRARMDDVRDTAAGVTSVTVKASVSTELSGTVQELTGTSNALDSTVPVITSGSSVTSLATNAITTATGSILSAGVTDGGGTNTAYTVAPAAYAIDGLTPNGGNERIGSASAANVASGAHTATFTLPASANCLAGQAAYAVAVAAAAMPPGETVVSPGAARGPDNATVAWSLGRKFDTVPNKQPPGAQVVTPAAVPPHAADNWTYVETVLTVMPPPGEQVVAPAAVPPHSGDNWTFTSTPRRPALTTAANQPSALFGAPAFGQSYFSEGEPALPAPPGQQVIAPAAVAPHTADNWTFAPGSPHLLVTQAQSPLPPGRTSIDPGSRQVPGPTFAPGAALEVVSTAQSPLPPGRVSIDPGARQLAADTFVGKLHRGFDTVPPKMPPGVPLATPAGRPPHDGDNWTTLDSVYPGMAAPAPPPGVQVTTVAAIAPHSGDNWTLTRSLHRGFDTVPNKQPPGQQLVTAAAIPPHAGDNWTYVETLFCGFAAPLPMPIGQQSVDPAPFSPRARDNWTQSPSLFPGMAPAGLPVGNQLVVRVPAYAQPDQSLGQSLDLAQTQAPIGAQLVVGIPATRPADSSILPSLFPGMAGPVSLPSGQIVVVPPQKPQHAGDNYSFAPGTPLELLRVQAPLPPGQQISNYVLVWRQAPNHTSVQSSPILPSSQVQRDLVYVSGPPEAKWRAGQPSSAWSMGDPGHRWSTGQGAAGWTAGSPEDDFTTRPAQE